MQSFNDPIVPQRQENGFPFFFYLKKIFFGSMHIISMPESRSDIKSLSRANETKSAYQSELLPRYQITKKKEATLDKTKLDISRSATSNSCVLNDPKETETSQTPIPINWDEIRKEIFTCKSKKVEYETSTDNSQYDNEYILTPDSQNVKEQISTHDSQKVDEQKSTNDSKSVKRETTTCNPKNVEYKNPDVLISHYEKPNLRYLIVEDVKRNKDHYCASQKEKIDDDFHDFKSTGPQIFTVYNAASTEKTEERKTTGKDKYICRLPVCRIESDSGKTVYYLDQSIRCKVCYEEMVAEYNVFFTGDTLMIDQIKTDYLLPYKKKNVTGLMHSKCSILENSVNYKYDRYYCKLSYDTKQREPVNILYQFCMLIITLALIVLPMFLNFLWHYMQAIKFPLYQIWAYLYCILFISLIINELYRYNKKMADIVETMHLMIWN